MLWVGVWWEGSDENWFWPRFLLWWINIVHIPAGISRLWPGVSNYVRPTQLCRDNCCTQTINLHCLCSLDLNLIIFISHVCLLPLSKCLHWPVNLITVSTAYSHNRPGLTLSTVFPSSYPALLHIFYNLKQTFSSLFPNSDEGSKTWNVFPQMLPALVNVSICFHFMYHPVLVVPKQRQGRGRVSQHVTVVYVIKFMNKNSWLKPVNPLIIVLPD